MGNDSTKLVENIKAHILCSIRFRKSCPLRDNVEKYGTAGEATDNVHHTAQALCMLDN
jgi:hypothetical protein